MYSFSCVQMHIIALHPQLKPTGKDRVLFLLLVLFIAEIYCYSCEVNLSKRFIIRHFLIVLHLVAYIHREFKGNDGLVHLTPCIYHILICGCSNAQYRMAYLTEAQLQGLVLIFSSSCALHWLITGWKSGCLVVKWRGRPSGEGYGCDERCGSPTAGAPSPCHQALIVLAGTLRGSVLHPTFFPTYLGHLHKGRLQRAQTCMRCLSTNTFKGYLVCPAGVLPDPVNINRMSMLSIHWICTEHRCFCVKIEEVETLGWDIGASVLWLSVFLCCV